MVTRYQLETIEKMAKDKSDNKTIDTFADLLDALETTEPEERRKPGPKPIGERAMTPAEKQKAYRDRLRSIKNKASQ